MRTISLILMSALFISACSGGSSGGDATTPPPQTSNSKPTAVISFISGETVFVGDEISFLGDSSSDPDGNTPLTFQWNFSGAETSIQQSTDANTGAVKFNEAGTVAVTLVVTDSLGLASDTQNTTITVTEGVSNLAPVGAISHDNGVGTIGSTGDVSITSGGIIVFNSDVSDPEGDTISYIWTFEGGSPSSSISAGPVSVSYDAIGNFSASLTANDDQGNSTIFPSTPISISVTSLAANQPEFKFVSQIAPTMVGDVATYELSAEENVNVVVSSPEGNWTTAMMRYNGLQQLPLLKARRGDKIKVTVTNNLSTSFEDTTIHWHGFKIPGAEDGGPDFPVSAGSSRDYQFTMQQAAASLWFHPHAIGTTATQVYKGLAGGFILSDDISDALESNLQIPTGESDIALMVQDRRFADDPNNTGVRALIYQGGNGMLGDRILVNGVEMPTLKVATRQYRFRIFNSSNARTYDFALDNNANFIIVGSDGGLLNSPISVNHVMLGAGERAEIVVDFRASFNDRLKLVSRAFSAGNGGGGMGNSSSSLPNGSAFDIMVFDVSTQVDDLVQLYTALPASADINTRLSEAESSMTRDFVMSMVMGPGSGPGGGPQYLINGVAFDVNRIDESIVSGATEIWEISNTSQIAHPFHAHAIQWQILDRGATGSVLIPSTGIDLGWKDTVLVQPGETVRFIGQFDPVINTGKYMYHCHILEHEDNGMMGTFFIMP